MVEGDEVGERTIHSLCQYMKSPPQHFMYLLKSFRDGLTEWTVLNQFI